MRDHKSYKADHTCTIYCKPDHYRSNDQIKSSQPVQISSQCDRYIISNSIRFRLRYCVQKIITQINVTGSITPTLLQLAPARLPIIHFITSVAAFFVIGDIDNKIGKSRTYRTDGHSGKDQFSRSSFFRPCLQWQLLQKK